MGKKRKTRKKTGRARKKALRARATPAKPRKIKVFISWSGANAQPVAEKLGECLSVIVPTVDPFFSPKIPGGIEWRGALGKALRSAHFGIILLTKENQSSPWLNFEAGSLWGTPFARRRIFPLLLDMTPDAVKGPMSLFQAKQFDKPGMRELCATLARKAKLTHGKLETNFEMVWPQIEKLL